MTITEIEPAASADIAVRPAMAPEVYQRLPKNIFADGVSSGDHKVIGRLWVMGSLVFGLFALVADFLVRLERLASGDPTGNTQIFSNVSTYEQWFSLHRVSLVFLFVLPLLIGIAMIVVPLQIGAPSLAFPRAAAAALWSWAVAGTILVVSWAIDGGFVVRDAAVPSQATQLSMLAFAAVVLSLLTAAMVLVTTIFTERSQGMSLYNVPLFTWSILVAGGVWLLSLPVLVSNLMVMWIDARGVAAQSFGNVDLYGQVNWVFDQPQVFAFAIPVLGMLGETVPVAFRRRLKGYDMAMVAIGAFGAFSFGAYAQTFFNPNANTTWLYVLGSITLILPILAFLGSCALTAKAAGRAPVFSAHLALSGMALVALLAAGALAAVRVLDSLLAPVLRAINWIVGFLRDAIGGTKLVRRTGSTNEWFVQDSSGDFVTNLVPIGYSDQAVANYDRAQAAFDRSGAVDHLQLTPAGVDALGTETIFSLNNNGELPFASDAGNAFIRDYTNTAVTQDRSWDWLRHFEGWVSETFDEIAATSVAGAMMQLALVAGLLAGVAGLFYWSSKIFGRRLPTGIGMLAGLSLLGGAVLSALPDAISGFLEQPEFVDPRNGAYAARDGVEVLNLISLIGSAGVFAGFALVLLAVPASVFLGSDDDDEDTDNRNPVGGHTLEWLTDSPPPPGNFDGPFVVTSEAPLLDDDFVNPYAEGASA